MEEEDDDDAELCMGLQRSTWKKRKERKEGT
jgi:hypothetical protein